MHLDQHAIAAWIARASAAGFQGFGGRCAAAAIAINRVIFDGKAALIGGLNDAFLDHNSLVGHIAVSHAGLIWDADGRPKSESDLESWGMLDPEDADYADRAAALGFEWTEEAAYGACIFDFENEADILKHFGTDHLDELVSILEATRPAG
jgi:hypothetical protein